MARREVFGSVLIGDLKGTVRNVKCTGRVFFSRRKLSGRELPGGRGTVRMAVLSVREFANHLVYLQLSFAESTVDYS